MIMYILPQGIYFWPAKIAFWSNSVDWLDAS